MLSRHVRVGVHARGSLHPVRTNGGPVVHTCGLISSRELPLHVVVDRVAAGLHHQPVLGQFDRRIQLSRRIADTTVKVFALHILELTGGERPHRQLVRHAVAVRGDHELALGVGTPSVSISSRFQSLAASLGLVPGQHWDLIITLDDATTQHDSMCFVEEEGTASSFQGMAEVIERRGLPSSLYTDRGSHYWTTPEAGGKVDRDNPTQFGRAMRQLGVEMIPAYSPEARGRCERMFNTHQERLPKELAAHGIDTMPEANRYLAEHYREAFNEEFAVPATEPGTAFVSFIGPGLADIVCEHHQRTVGRDNCVSFERKRLQIPAQAHRCHFHLGAGRVHRYPDGRLAVFHGPRKLAEYECDGSLVADAPAAEHGHHARSAAAR